ncbi:MAG: nucleotidyl transferase AbiEii/AbiGii toxin family protein [bacterium]
MKFSLISQNEFLIITNRILKYPAHIAEKDYFLALTLKTIYESDLKNRLVFKGGTALHHFYLPQYRFSEDLDFTSTDQKVTIEDVRKVFKNHSNFIIKKDYVSPITVKVEKLQYSGILAQPSSLKIDISNVKNLVLPVIERKYKNVWRLDVQAKVMDILEICAEKLSATSGRIRYRDFYDIYLITQELKIKINDAVELLHKKNIEKPISKKLILKNWQVAKNTKIDDLDTIYLKKEITDQEIEKFLNSLHFKEIVVSRS